MTVAVPPVRTLALIHGLHEVKLARQQLNLGAENGLLVQRQLGAKYWIGTHDEVKHASGLVSWLLGRNFRRVRWCRRLRFRLRLAGALDCPGERANRIGFFRLCHDCYPLRTRTEPFGSIDIKLLRAHINVNRTTWFDLFSTAGTA